MIQQPDDGCRFEYVKGMPDADAGEMNYEERGRTSGGAIQPRVLSMEPGTLVLFRRRDAIHRVTPNESDRMRMLGGPGLQRRTRCGAVRERQNDIVRKAGLIGRQGAAVYTSRDSFAVNSI